jgi:hypothetical protein
MPAVRCLVLVGVVSCAILLPSSGLAHRPEKGPGRELVQIQGYKNVLPRGVTVEREIALISLAEKYSFHATRWLQITPGNGAPVKTPEPSTLVLQGSPGDLNRFAAARPEQRVSILAERRPGSSDLFVLTLDLCPQD